MRIRISYVTDGDKIQDQAEVNNFPVESWQWPSISAVDLHRCLMQASISVSWSDFPNLELRLLDDYFLYFFRCRCLSLPFNAVPPRFINSQCIVNFRFFFKIGVTALKKNADGIEFLHICPVIRSILSKKIIVVSYTREKFLIKESWIEGLIIF